MNGLPRTPQRSRRKLKQHLKNKHAEVPQLDAFPEAQVDPTGDLDRRYTTRAFDAWCRGKAHVDEWDLDVAADDESHLADRWFGIEVDGLKQSWSPTSNTPHWRVWCNPPFSLLDPWLEKANALMTCRDVPCVTLAMVLPANRTEQPFWQRWVEPFRDGRSMYDFTLRTFFPPGRTRYGHPGNREGVNSGSPDFASVLLVWSTLW